MKNKVTDYERQLRELREGVERIARKLEIHHQKSWISMSKECAADLRELLDG